MQKISVLLLAILMVVSGCAKKQPPPSDINGYPVDESNGELSHLRCDAMRDTATTLAAQSALAWSSEHINKMLEQNERALDATFNFRALLLEHDVLPPVLTTGRDPLNLDNPETIRLADQVYKIESPPRFVTAPPTWRDYLLMDYKPPEKPSNALLPRTDEERKIWNDAVAVGWKNGIDQANQIFSANMGRLKRDLNGMVLYRVLLAQKMVTPPYVAKTDLGVTGDDNQIRINDQVLRITATSRLVPDSKQWRAIVLPGTEGAIREQGTEGTKTLSDGAPPE
ncbi:MAG: type IV secretion system DotC family protein [Gammaproteobacteria bacterium]